MDIRGVVNGTVSSGSVPTDMLFETVNNGTVYEHMRITSGGNVGIGTPSPSGNFQVEGRTILDSTDHDHGDLQIGNPIPNGEASMAFISGVTAYGDSPSSTNGNGNIWGVGAGVWGIGGNTFGIGNTGYGGSILNVTSTGIVGVGTSTPDPNSQMHVMTPWGSTNKWLFEVSGYGYNKYFRILAGSVWWCAMALRDASGDLNVVINSTGDSWIPGTLWQNSDANLKKDITPIPNSLDSVRKMTGVTFYWKPEASTERNRQIGLIAQDVEKAFPEAVATSPTGHKTVNYPGLIGPIVNAVKELYEKTVDHNQAIKLLKEETQTLKAQNHDLQARLDRQQEAIDLLTKRLAQSEVPK